MFRFSEQETGVAGCSRFEAAHEVHAIFKRKPRARESAGVFCFLPCGNVYALRLCT
jgi:hypothetical protein